MQVSDNVNSEGSNIFSDVNEIHQMCNPFTIFCFHSSCELGHVRIFQGWEWFLSCLLIRHAQLNVNHLNCSHLIYDCLRNYILYQFSNFWYLYVTFHFTLQLQPVFFAIAYPSSLKNTLYLPLRNHARKSYDSLSPLTIVFVSEIPRYSNP